MHSRRLCPTLHKPEEENALSRAMLESLADGLADVARHDYILLDMDEHIATVGKYWGQYGLAPQVRYQSCSIEAVPW